jgi:hypothetical protein
VVPGNRHIFINVKYWTGWIGEQAGVAALSAFEASGDGVGLETWRLGHDPCDIIEIWTGVKCSGDRKQNQTSTQKVRFLVAEIERC